MTAHLATHFGPCYFKVAKFVDDAPIAHTDEAAIEIDDDDDETAHDVGDSKDLEVSVAKRPKIENAVLVPGFTISADGSILRNK